MRLDCYLAQNGYADSRERAKRLILAGAVTVDGRVINKPALEIEGEPKIAVTEEEFVGRGGEKLKAALSLFGVDPKGLRALDVGASTGGFTHCLLEKGAASVVALDAGCDQLHPKLRADARVTNVEKYNARELSACDVGTFDLVVMDVSFISATYILPRFPEVMERGALAIVLIKPQFEAGRAAIGKNGLVKSKKERFAAVLRVLECASTIDFGCFGFALSPIEGGDGNREYIAAFRRGGASLVDAAYVKRIIDGENERR